MRLSCVWLPLACFLAAVSPTRVEAQRTDSIALPFRSDTLLSQSDSLAIFALIDSLLQLQEGGSSQMAFRLGYNSNVLSAGRTLGVENFGLSPGLSYYHKSGFYADVMSYWSREFDPSLYLVTASAGYLRVFSRRFSFVADYNRYFYHTRDGDEFIPYRNRLSVSPYMEFRPVGFRLDYSFYFGDKSAHRIMPGVSLRLSKKNFLKMDRISLNPSFYVLLGNEHITEIIFPTTDEELAAARMRQAQGDPNWWYDISDKDVFGLMNYSITLPLSISCGAFYFNFSYSYSIPKALPGEPFRFEKSSYITSSATFFIDLKKH